MPYGHVSEKREQVTWSSTWVLANQTRWVCARWVEMPQGDSMPPRFCCDSSANCLDITQKGVHTLHEIDSHIILLCPYGLSTLSYVVSGIGTMGGVP